MKKLIITAAIVCAAVVSQAAKVNWEGFDIMDAAGNEYYTGDATLYCVEIAGLSASGSVTEGEVEGDQLVSDMLVSGETYNFYFTSTDADGNIFTSETKSAKMLSVGAASVSFGGGTWSTVPEPTSGLLLLLGVAGLALKRKRA